jgi:prolyl-tRNA editing enzyme YbaK/EbsC (Cys-tRNA(Pro) deacylase)
VWIFLSHSGRDKALVRELKEHFPPWLKSWIDEDRLLFGEELEPSLKEAIDSNVDYVVLLFGRDAARSGWVKREIAWALEREEQLNRTFLLPVLLDDIRDELDDFGLAGRLTLEIADFTVASTEFLAERLVNHLAGWMSEQLARVPVRWKTDVVADALRGLMEEALVLTDEIPQSSRDAVELELVRPFINDLAASRGGAVPLSAARYYKRIFMDMGRADSAYEVVAVSTLSSELWRRDADQKRYATRNFEAVARGASIRRLFVVPATGASSYVDVVRRQSDEGIEVRVASTTLLARVSDLEDFVLFRTSEGARAYVAQPSIDGSRRIRSGSLRTSEYATDSMRSTFEDAWDLADPPVEFFRTRAATAPTRPSGGAPGLNFQVYHLDSPVVSCEEAARARNIPLAQELKTLLLNTDNGLVAAHLPGDGVLHLRKVKARLASSQVYLADPEDLLKLGLSPGTVSAVLDPVWSLPHLVSRRLLHLPTVMTNNGTLTAYFEFAPSVLTEAASVVVDDFEK